MKFRVRDDDEKGEFQVKNVDKESATRSFVAKSVIITGLLILIAVAVYAACVRNDSQLREATGSITTLMSFVLGYYFAKSRDG